MSLLELYLKGQKQFHTLNFLIFKRQVGTTGGEIGTSFRQNRYQAKNLPNILFQMHTQVELLILNFFLSQKESFGTAF